MNANDELETAVTQLLEEFQHDKPPSTPIVGLSFFEDSHGGFLTAELSDGSQVFITLDFGQAMTVFHAQPSPKPVRHLFLVRNSTK